MERENQQSENIIDLIKSDISTFLKFKNAMAKIKKIFNESCKDHTAFFGKFREHIQEFNNWKIDCDEIDLEKILWIQSCEKWFAHIETEITQPRFIDVLCQTLEDMSIQLETTMSTEKISRDGYPNIFACIEWLNSKEKDGKKLVESEIDRIQKEENISSVKEAIDRLEKRLNELKEE
jgi:hypothetical protein